MKAICLLITTVLFVSCSRQHTAQASLSDTENNTTSSHSSVRVSETTAPLFTISDGELHIPDIDDRLISQPTELLRIQPADFQNQKQVYRDRVVLMSGYSETKPFLAPTTASQFAIVASAAPVEDIFPRIRVSAVTQTPVTTTTLYEGFFVSRSMQELVLDCPAALRGRQTSLRVDFLNTAMIHDRRILYIAWISIR